MIKSHIANTATSRWVRGEIANNRSSYTDTHGKLDTYRLGRAAYTMFCDLEIGLSMDMALSIAHDRAVEMGEA